MVPTYAFKELSLSAQAKSKKKSHLLRINNTKTRTYQSEGNEATKSTKKKKVPANFCSTRLSSRAYTYSAWFTDNYAVFVVRWSFGGTTCSKVIFGKDLCASPHEGYRRLASASCHSLVQGWLDPRYNREGRGGGPPLFSVVGSVVPETKSWKHGYLS